MADSNDATNPAASACALARRHEFNKSLLGDYIDRFLTESTMRDVTH
jgi:hypothetical protein